jgi:hypothetical protein
MAKGNLNLGWSNKYDGQTQILSCGPNSDPAPDLGNVLHGFESEMIRVTHPVAWQFNPGEFYAIEKAL